MIYITRLWWCRNGISIPRRMLEFVSATEFHRQDHRTASDLYQSDTGRYIAKIGMLIWKLSKWHLCDRFIDIEIRYLSAVEQNKWWIAGNVLRVLDLITHSAIKWYVSWPLYLFGALKTRCLWGSLYEYHYIATKWLCSFVRDGKCAQST